MPSLLFSGFFSRQREERERRTGAGGDGLHSGRVLLPLFAALIARRAKAAVIYGTLLPCKNFGRRRLFSVAKQQPSESVRGIFISILIWFVGC